MKKIYLAGICALFIFLSCTKHDENNEVNNVDYAFLQQVSMSNNLEISAGELAGSRSANSGVRSISQELVTEYTKAQAELQTLAAQLKVNLNDNGENEKIISGLKTVGASGFDTAYIRSCVKSHKKTLEIYQAAFNEGNNATVKGYVHRHLSLITSFYLKADSVARSFE